MRMSEREIDYTDDRGTGIPMIPVLDRRLPGPGSSFSQPLPAEKAQVTNPKLTPTLWGVNPIGAGHGSEFLYS